MGDHMWLSVPTAGLAPWRSRMLRLAATSGSSVEWMCAGAASGVAGRLYGAERRGQN